VCSKVFQIEEDFGRARVYDQSGDIELIQEAIESWCECQCPFLLCVLFVNLSIIQASSLEIWCKNSSKQKKMQSGENNFSVGLKS